MGNLYVSLADHPLGIYAIDLLDLQGERIGMLHYPHSAHQLIDPIMSRGVNRAGSLSFDINRTHPYYYALQYLQCYVRVYRDGDCIFDCRPTDITEKGGVKSITCEGALAFLNDTVQWRKSYKNYTPQQYLQDKIDWHNNHVDDAIRQFSVDCTVSGNLGEIADNDLPNTFENINNKLVSKLGGYLDIGYTSHHITVPGFDNSWISSLISVDKTIMYKPELPKLDGQRVQASVNLLSCEKGMDISDVMTVLIPTGASSSGSGLPITIQAVNDDKSYVECADAVAAYGKIWGTHNWNDISDPAELKAKAQEYVNGLYNKPWSITIGAADLYYSSKSSVPLEYGKKILVESSSDSIDGWFDCTDEEIHIAEPAKNKYTLGGKRQTMSGMGIRQEISK